MGEAGGEHLLFWCPAVGAAWRDLAHDRCSLFDAIRGSPGSEGLDDTLVALLHQASFLCGSLLGRVTITWEVSARWILRAARLRGGRP